MFCDRCGQQFLPRETVCAKCRAVSARYCLQLAGLATLALAIACNSYSSLALFPRLLAAHHAWPFRVWIKLNGALSAYGWAAAAAGLLVWSFWLRRGYRIQKEEWLARVLVIQLLAVGFIALPIRWMSWKFFAAVRLAIAEHRAIAPTAAWAMVILVAGLLCMDADVRESLVGQGRLLNVVCLVVLLLVMTMTLAGWAVS